MNDEQKRKEMTESLLTDLTGFPKRFQREGQALSSAFKIPELSITMSQMDRRKLVETLTGMTGSREMLMNTLDGIRGNDIVQTILSVIKDDAFFTAEGEILEVSYDEGREVESDTQKKVNGLIEEFMRDCRLVPLVLNILDDFLIYGEYPLRVVVSPNGDGVISIKDDLDPVTTVGVYDIDEPQFFLEKSSRGYFVRSPKEVVQFTLAPTKLRIKTMDARNERYQLPEYIRVGRSILYPALQKIKQLQTIELSSQLTDLKRAVAPILVSVAVPPGSQPEDVTEIIKKYEQHLQETFRGMPDLENPSIGDLMATVTNFKVVPNFTDGKGVITTLDLLGNQQDTDTRIDRLRLSIAMAIGMPPYYLVTGQMGQGERSKMETLKLHSRYSRMLVAVQNSVAEGIRRLVALHVINKGIFIDDSLIKVRFKNVMNVDHMDQMEYVVASAQTLRDLWGTLAEILGNDEVKAELDSKEFIDLVNQFLTVGDVARNPLLKFVEYPVQPGGEGGMPGVGGGGGGLGGGAVGMPGAGEAEMFEPEVGEGGGFEGTEMTNTAPIPPADFGPQEGEAGVEGLPPEEAPPGDIGAGIGGEAGVEGGEAAETAPGEAGMAPEEIPPPEEGPVGSSVGNSALEAGAPLPAEELPKASSSGTAAPR